MASSPSSSRSSRLSGPPSSDSDRVGGLVTDTGELYLDRSAVASDQSAPTSPYSLSEKASPRPAGVVMFVLTFNACVSRDFDPGRGRRRGQPARPRAHAELGRADP